MFLLDRGRFVRAAGDDQLAATTPIYVQVLVAGDTPDLVDRVEHGRVGVARRRVPVQLLEAAQGDVQTRRTPGAVPARRAEAADVTFEDDHTQAGLLAQQVVRRP